MHCLIYIVFFTTECAYLCKTSKFISQILLISNLEKLNFPCWCETPYSGGATNPKTHKNHKFSSHIVFLGHLVSKLVSLLILLKKLSGKISKN